MKKLFIKDMSNEQLKKVFEANERLRSLVLENSLETEMFYITKQLDYFRKSLKDYSIGTYQSNYITVKDNGKFIRGVEEMENSIPLFNYKHKTLKKALLILEKYENENMYTKKFDKLEAQLDEIVEELSNDVAQRFTDILDNCEDTILEYFLDFYAEVILNKDCYVDEETFILKEDIVTSY